MSQVSAKTSRPTLSLNSPAPGITNNKKNRSETPNSNTEKSDSRSSTPANQMIEGEKIITPKGKSQRRVSNDSAKVRNSPKPIIVLEDTEKSKNGHSDVEKKDINNGTNGKNASDENGEQKKVEDKKQETAKSNSNNKKNKDIITPKEQEEENTEKIKKQSSNKQAENELLVEKIQPEMESLIVESEGHADSPMPKSIGKSPRILHYTQGPAVRGARISPFKKASERLQNASTIVNLSTVSEQSTESGNSAAPSPVLLDNSPVLIPQGRVSGRRNTRPIKDIKLTYPRLNDSTSSTNATIGSPIHNDSLKTPIVAHLISRKRKDDGSPEYEDIHSVSPSKKIRLDFSGFLGYVTTPVTMLKNRLSRVGLHSSTPRQLETVENIADVSGNMEAENAKPDVSEAIEATESTTDKNIEDIKTDDIETPTSIDNSDIEIKERPRRSVCNIM